MANGITATKMSQKDVVNDFNLFVAGKTGAFKGIKADGDGVTMRNLQSKKVLQPNVEITTMSWSDDNELEILLGTTNNLVRVYEIYSRSFQVIPVKYGTGPIIGLSKINGQVTTCTQSGHVRVWKKTKKKNKNRNKNKNNNEDEDEDVEDIMLHVGDVSCMRKYYQKEGIIGSGGNNNDLKVWNLETKSTIFSAKNVRKDMLELEVPIWVSDLVFFPNCEYKIADVTRYGQVRLYDTKAQRRPVIEIDVQKKALTTMSLCKNENQVVVGSGRGDIMLADFRGKGKIVHAYKGAVGSIRQVVADPALPYIVSVSLDRYMRIHHLETKMLVEQTYLKSKPNCVLMKSTFGVDMKEIKEEKVDEEEVKETQRENTDSEIDDEYDKMFDKMENVSDDSDEPLRKKSRKNKKR